MKTFSAKASEVPGQWWVIDASGPGAGKVAVKAAISCVQRENGFHAHTWIRAIL